jgi:hypothetical protein
VKPVRIEYFQGMQSSSSKRKQRQQRYNQNYHLVRNQGQDRDIRILKSHCDLCKGELPKEADNIQYRINVLDEIDDSFESEYDKHEPRLLLCSSCSKVYNIPSY